MARLDEDLFERIQAATNDDTIGMRITDRIAALVGPLEAEKDQLKAEKQACRQYMLRLDAQLRRVDRVLRAAGAYSQNGQSLRAGRKAGTGRVSEEKQQKILDLLIKAERPLTNRELHELSGFTAATTNAATHWLRKEGRIRLAGYGGLTNQAALFLPVEVLEEVAA